MRLARQAIAGRPPTSSTTDEFRAGGRSTPARRSKGDGHELTRGSAIPLVVKSNDGRPTKIEGNALHPDSNGGTDRYAQASILNLYDPDRAQRFANALRAGTVWIDDLGLY